MKKKKNGKFGTLTRDRFGFMPLVGSFMQQLPYPSPGYLFKDFEVMITTVPRLKFEPVSTD